MELIEKKLSELIPYANNPRKNDGAVDAVMESIKQCGYISPIVIDENNEILAGHTRYKAMKKLKIKTAKCVVMEGLTEEQKRKYRILDNKTGEFAEWDIDLLNLELEGLDFEGFDFGFDIEKSFSPDEFGDEFSLADGKKPEICQMTFTLHQKQKELIEYAITITKDYITETFGNTNGNGNALYEVVRQWAEQRK